MSSDYECLPGSDPQARRGNELFFETLVRGYVDVEKDQRFIRREWLAKELDAKLAEAGSRFVLLTAEPGAGKSAFMAQLAHDHAEWLRYFIRRDQCSLLADVSDKSFLLRIGYQLAALHPELFSQQELRLSVEQHIGQVAAKAEVVGAEVGRLVASPFYQKVLEIEQHVEANQGKVVGLRVEELVAEARLLPAEDLLQLALIHPAEALQRIDPTKKIVVLVDALDEIRYHPTPENILVWLTNCPELPENIQFVLTSRPPDEALTLFCDKQAPHVSALAIDEEDVNVKKDAETFVQRLIAEEALAQELAQAKIDGKGFAQRAYDKARGNLGYLDALARSIDQALARQDSKTLRDLLSLEELPADLNGLYAFFLHQIKGGVAEEHIVGRDSNGKTYSTEVWPAVYMPVLGLLAVAAEPLESELIVKLGDIAVDFKWISPALNRLRQFLDVIDGRYRLYHATMAEFLTDAKTRDNTETHDLHQDAQQWHRRIVDYYWQTYHERWDRCEDAYAFNHLTAHLLELGDSAKVRELICEKWLLAPSRKRDPSGSIRFLVDIDHAWSLALARLEEGEKIVELFRLQTARQLVSQHTSVHSDTDFQTLVWLGRIDEAVGICRLRPQPEARYSGLMVIFTSLNEMCQAESPAPRVRTTDEIAQWRRQLLKEAEWAASVMQSDDSRVVAALGAVGSALSRIADHRADALFDQAKRIALDRYWFEREAIPSGGERFGIFALMTLAEVLIGAGRFVDAEGIAQLIEDERLSENLALAMAKAGDLHEADRVARAIRDPGERAKALATVASALAQANRYEEAEQIARSIDPVEEKVRALCTLAAALGRAKDARATALFGEVQGLIGKIEGGRQFEAIFCLSAALVQAARYADAEVAIHQIGNAEKRVEALVLLADALAADGDARASRTLDDALEATGAIEGEFQQARSLGVLVEELVRAECYAKAEEISRTRLEGSAQAQALLIVATGLAKAENSHASIAMDAARHAAQGIEDKRLRATALLNLALEFAKLGDSQTNQVLDEARNTVYGIEDAQERLKQLSDMAYALARKGIDRARTSLDDAIEARRQQAVQAACGQEPAMKDMAALLIDAGCFAQAEELTGLVASPDERATLLRNLGAGLARIQDKRADVVFEEALNAAQLISDSQKRAETICNLANTLDSVKDTRTKAVFDLALEAVHAIEDPNARVLALLDLAYASAKAGIDWTNVACDEALGLATTLHRAELLTRVSDTIGACGYLEKSEQVAYAITDDWYRSVALERLAARLAHAGECLKADEAAHAIPDCSERVKALVALASVCAQNDYLRASADLDEAVEVAYTIDADLVRARVLCDLGLYFTQAGDSRSTAVLSDAVDAAGAITDPETQSIELTHLGLALHRIGDSRADTVFSRAWEAGNDTEGPCEFYMRDNTRRELASALSQCGQFEKARRVAQAIDFEESKGPALLDLALAVAESGQEAADSIFDEAEQQLRRVQKDWIRHSEAHSLVEAVARSGRYTKLLKLLQSFEFDEFVNLVIAIAPCLGRCNPKVSVELIREVSGVAGWLRPRWRQVHNILRA